MDIINMEALYDIGSGDLKDIWESDLDPSDTIKFSSDSDMQDWFERDVKLPGVILHDKLMSDALLGTLPIKTEHSYSLNSDGDSMPESPGSLKNKMDDMEDECYPAISMNTATSNSRRLIDPTQLTTTHINPAEISLNNCAILTNNHHTNNNHSSNNSSNSHSNSNHNNNNNNHHNNHNNNSSTCHLTILNNCSTNSISINPNSLQNNLNPLAINIRPKYVTDQLYSGNSSSTSSLSDIDIDDSCIKDEPMSPADSSCPPSPLNANTTTYLTNMTSPFTNTTNIVLEHKNRSIQLTPASQSLLKAQHISLGNGISATISPSNSNSLTSSPQRLVIPKVNIKIEPPITQTTNQQQHLQQQQQQHQQQQQQQQQQHLFGLPPTPPSSLPSDESEGNQSPEHHLLSPMSPPMQQQLITSSSSSSSTNSSPAASPSTSTSRRNHNNNGSQTISASSASHHNNPNTNGGGRGYTGTSTRQPIHTPLISSQPKGSTGTLILTEEEKRTLLAEGYPIPTRLPLTKAEEKSLKKIRRKIKNKISAQESRRKKKEYMDQLERKVEILVSENTDYKKRVESLEESNANLLTQLAKLQTLVNRQKK